VTDSNPLVTTAIEQLGQRRADAVTTLEVLQGNRQQTEVDSSSLENPRAVLEYIDFFAEMFSRAAGECERIALELPQGVARAHSDALRQIASNSAAEQRRCLVFRDKCINKPLPDERMRPLLNDISVTTRDQLTAFRDLSNVAGRLEEMLTPSTPSPEDKKGFDRRALFTRLFKP
jgi:hypothetical protein